MKPEPSTTKQDIELARLAAAGEADAQRRVGEIAQPMIHYQTGRFCPRFCHDNRRRYQCTLPDLAPPRSGDRALCEWGNASYGWMLDELTRPQRLQRFEGRDGASLSGYLFHIANSLPFYERWKDWRLGRRSHVPTYIQDLAPEAARVFHRLRHGDNIALIAQRLGLSEASTERLAREIVVELTRRQRLHLLNPTREVSLSGLGMADDNEDSEAIEADLACEDLSAEALDARIKLQQAWQQLSATEQFVLEAMLIDGQDADDVLGALKRLNIALSPRVPAQQTDRQQLYYFRRKAQARLARLSGLLED
ncbi:MAG TPA: hypothetical protein ENJ17_05790 [Gammaproteobacteria bacterium]|nr:hypothetical protein [Gammaproteobacteria bacterium]